MTKIVSEEIADHSPCPFGSFQSVPLGEMNITCPRCSRRPLQCSHFSSEGSLPSPPAFVTGNAIILGNVPSYQLGFSYSLSIHTPLGPSGGCQEERK